jgi:general secretion pathway protein L
LDALKPRSVQLLFDGAEQGTVAIPVNGHAVEVEKRARLRRAVLTALAVLCLVELGGAAAISYAWQRADTSLAAVAAEIAEQRRKLPTNPQTPIAGRDVDAILARKQSSPVAVLVLDALSSALPDDTWLTELRLAENRVRIVGISRNVAALVPVLEATPGFAEPSFFAPTTRLPDGQGDRFHLEARLMPPIRDDK